MHTFQKDNNKIVKNKNKEYTIQKKTGMKNKTRTVGCGIKGEAPKRISRNSFRCQLQEETLLPVFA